MLTVDLEQELLKQNAKIATPSELLHIKEYEKVGTTGFNWNQIGFNHIDQAGKVKSRIHNQKAETAAFNQDRVFHISQIEQIAMKYYLRFLPACYYSGSVDHELPLKIGTFENKERKLGGSDKRSPRNVG